jgi:hypothetical protein
MGMIRGMSPLVATVVRILGHIWNIPNTAFALLISAGGKLSIDYENRVIIVRGSITGKVLGRFGYAGMCIGDIVFVSLELSPSTFRHEVAHAQQGRLTGIFYLPLTLLGYLYGFLRYPRDIHKAHDASPMEIWADIWSDNQDRNLILAERSQNTHLR